MAFEYEGPVEEEEKIKSPLNPSKNFLQREWDAIKQDFSSPQAFLKSFLGPGLVSKGLGKVMGTSPETAYEDLINTGLGAASMHPALGVGARLAASVGIPALGHLLSQGVNDPAGFAIKTGAGLATQGLSEVPITGIAKQIFMQKAANKTKAKFAQDKIESVVKFKDQVQDIRDENAKILRKAKDTYKLGKHKTLDQYNKEAAEQQLRYAEKMAIGADEAAAAMMNEVKGLVPAWKDLPSDVSGMTTAVLGKGPKLLSKEFDKSLKEVVKTARGKPIRISLKDAVALEIPQSGATQQNGRWFTTVDAGDLAEAVVGTGSKDWKRYRRIVAALDKENIGDPAARAAYKTGMGFKEFMAKSKAVEVLPEGSVLHTDRIVKAMSDDRLIDILRKRDIADVDEGLLQHARKAIPTPEAPIEKPVIEPFIAPEKIPLPRGPEEVLDPKALGVIEETTMPFTGSKSSRFGRMMAGGAAGAFASGLGHQLGLPMGFGAYSIPGAAGTLAGAALPDYWVTKAPGTEPLIGMLGALAAGTGTAGRQGITNFLEDKQALNYTPDPIQLEKERLRRLQDLGPLEEEEEITLEDLK